MERAITENQLSQKVADELKHFLADYPLQFPYMLRKYKASWDFLLPLINFI